MLRLLANENISADVVDALRQDGHDVAWIRADSPGIDDQAVLERAVQEQRILLTFDKDFGELAFRFGLPATCGIILARLPSTSAADLAAKLTPILSSRTDWVGQFAVIEVHRIRFRQLAPST